MLQRGRLEWAMDPGDFAHRDPADRIIVATALDRGAMSITADVQLGAYALVRTIWD
jgi:PIN domain nuclease of toxin-antitoxin system